MADGGDNIFVYLGGEQEVPDDVTHVIIDRSVKIIPREAFRNRANLMSVEMHDGIEIIEERAFQGCISLRGIKLLGVREIERAAFNCCSAMTDVEFGDKLETIGSHAFTFCFHLRRIAIPLKDNVFTLDAVYQQYTTQFAECRNLTTVDLVGGIHKTISSLLLERWRDEMNQEIVRINQVLPNTHVFQKTDAVRLWIRSVINRMEHYKAQHSALLKEDMTQLELAVWKAKLYEVEEESGSLDGTVAMKTKIDMESVRKERHITSGADIVISNVLPFLQLLE